MYSRESGQVVFWPIPHLRVRVAGELLFRQPSPTENPVSGELLRGPIFTAHRVARV
jgi:hypothetical protein